MQNGVSLETRDEDLVVKYGPYNQIYQGDEDLKPFVDQALSSLKYILADMNDIRKKYIRLGFHLAEFKNCGHYLKFGYATMEDFCAANLGLDKSTVSRCINVYHEFNASNFITYDNGVKKVGSAMELDSRYKEYSYSQLCEMVSMSDNEREQIRPDMTIKQIREIKKGNVSRDVSLVATSQQERFNITNYSVKKGIVQQNYVKNCKSLYDARLQIFDKNGKMFGISTFFDVLKNDGVSIILRLKDDYPDISDIFIKNV